MLSCVWKPLVFFHVLSVTRKGLISSKSSRNPLCPQIYYFSLHLLLQLGCWDHVLLGDKRWFCWSHWKQGDAKSSPDINSGCWQLPNTQPRDAEAVQTPSFLLKSLPSNSLQKSLQSLVKLIEQDRDLSHFLVRAALGISELCSIFPRKGTPKIPSNPSTAVCAASQDPQRDLSLSLLGDSWCTVIPAPSFQV